MEEKKQHNGAVSFLQADDVEALTDESMMDDCDHNEKHARTDTNTHKPGTQRERGREKTLCDTHEAQRTNVK